MRRPLSLICVAFVVSVFVGLQIVPLPSDSCAQEEGSQVCYLGEVYHKEYRYNSLLLYLRNVNQVDSTNIQLKNLGKENSSQEGILCYISDGKEPKLGSTVVVTGKVQLFLPSRNPGGFDQQMYYQIQNIGFALKEVTIIAESEKYSGYYEALYQLRRKMERTFDITMSEKDASIMKAMVLGNKAELDKDSKDLYQKSGISHILAISGLHISLIGMGLYKLLRKTKMPVIIATVIPVGIMVMYGDMIGSSASAYRAIFMFALKMGAEVIHRTYDMLTALALAAVCILIGQPLYIYHAGFLLSFGAIVGIGCIQEVLKTDTKQIIIDKKRQKKGEWIKKIGIQKIQESLLASISIFVIQFPIMISVYYEFPIYSFLLNLIIIPTMGVVMTLGISCILFGTIGTCVLGSGIAQILAVFCHVLLKLFEVLCECSMSLPGASWIVGEPETWRIVIYYGMIILLVGLHKFIKDCKKEKIRFPLGIKVIWILIAVLLLIGKVYNRLSITMLDVGQGDCIWIETQTGHHYLIDGGSTSEDKLCEYTLVPFLKQTGTATLDAVFLTHLDEDHISGVMELLESEEGIEVRKIVIAEAATRDEVYQELADLCNQKNIMLMHAKTGDKITDGELSMEILHPDAGYVTDSRNAYSLVMKMEYRGFHALFTGDVEPDGEENVIKELPEEWECHLYKVAHHGSRNSNSMELLEQIQPQLAIISCEEGNSYGHPHEETLERLETLGSKVMVTKDCGAIMIKIDKEITVQGWCKDN